MEPAFSVFAGGVEPIEGFFFAGPADAVRRHSIGIAPGVLFRKLFARHFHEGNQYGWTQPAIDRDAFVVQAINIGAQGAGRIELRSWLDVAVSANGQSTQRRIEEMRCDVLHLPLWRGGLLLPIFWRERAKQLQQ